MEKESSLHLDIHKVLETMENDRGLSKKRYLCATDQTLENDRGLSKSERTYCEQHFLTELHMAGAYLAKPYPNTVSFMLHEDEVLPRERCLFSGMKPSLPEPRFALAHSVLLSATGIHLPRCKGPFTEAHRCAVALFLGFGCFFRTARMLS